MFDPSLVHMRWPVRSQSVWYAPTKNLEKYADLRDDISQLLSHLSLCPLEALPQVITDAAPLQQGAASLLRVLNLVQTVDILHGAAHEGCPQNTVGNLLCLLASFLTVELEQCVVDVALEVRAEPGGEVGTLGFCGCQ